jgi:hypothetical protein
VLGLHACRDYRAVPVLACARCAAASVRCLSFPESVPDTNRYQWHGAVETWWPVGSYVLGVVSSAVCFPSWLARAVLLAHDVCAVIEPGRPVLGPVRLLRYVTQRLCRVVCDCWTDPQLPEKGGPPESVPAEIDCWLAGTGRRWGDVSSLADCCPVCCAVRCLSVPESVPAEILLAGRYGARRKLCLDYMLARRQLAFAGSILWLLMKQKPACRVL